MGEKKPKNNFKTKSCGIAAVAETNLSLPLNNQSDQKQLSTLCDGNQNGKMERGNHDGFDPLEIYLREIKKIPLLSRKQKIELAKKIRGGDKQAERRLTQANLHLAASIARKFINRGLNLLDLIQEGNLGLMKAVKKFDPAKGKFSTHAAWWIKQVINLALANQSRTIRLPVHIVISLDMLGQVEKNLAKKLEREPNNDELAEELNITIERVDCLKKFRNISNPASLSSPVKNHGQETTNRSILEEFISAPQPEPGYEQYALKPALDAYEATAALHDHKKLWSLVSQALGCANGNMIFKIVLQRNRGRSLKKILNGLGVTELTSNERMLYILLTKKFASEPLSLGDLAADLGITRERIRQIELDGKIRLKHQKWKKQFEQFL